MGDSVHVVVDTVDRRSGELKAALESADVATDDMERIAPSIEDLFVSLLTRRTTGDERRPGQRDQDRRRSI